MSYQVRAVHFGESRFPGPALYYMGRFGEILTIPFFFWVVRGEGRTLLVDVGASSAQAEAHNRGPAGRLGKGCGWTITPEKEPAARLAALGIAPGDVDTVILTHLHSDHCLNLPAFSDAEIVMARRAWEAVDSPDHPRLTPAGSYPPGIRELLRGALHKRFRLVEDGEEAVPGVRCRRVGGHSPDMTVVTVDTSAGEVVIASDAAISYESLELDWPSNGYNLLESLEALEWIRQRDGIVLPGHDWEVLERHPEGVIG